MKIVLIAFILLIAYPGYGQLPGKRLTGLVKLPNGQKLQQGDTLLLGPGTMVNRDFTYATHAGLPLLGQPLQRGFSGSSFVVDQVRMLDDPYFGKLFYAVIRAGVGTTIVELTKGLEAGEITAIKKRK